MRRMIWHAAAVVALVVMATSPAGVAERAELAGLYSSHGMNPDGTDYRGVVQIVPRGDAFVVRWWIFPRGVAGRLIAPPSAVGVGLLHGSTLAVSYYAAQTVGIVVYRIEDDGRRLVGEWAAAGDSGAVYPETLTRLTGSTPGPDPQPVDPSEQEAPASEDEGPGPAVLSL